MPFNGSGSFTVSDTIENGTLGDATEVQNILTDMASGLTNCMTKDGQQTVTSNLPMNGFKFTGVGAGSNRTDTATIANLMDDTGVFVSSVSGTANAITLLPSPAISAYATGQKFRFIVATTNSSSVTVAISGLAAKSLHSRQGVALINGDMLAGSLAEITYDGTRFILSGGGTQNNLTNKVITSCTLVTCVGSADPTVALGLATKQYVDAMWITGDVKATFRSTAQDGWVVMDDGTIGSASSGATTRANADTEALFTQLWNNVSDTYAPVSGARGASAAADFAANKTITLPRVLGRAMACAGAGSGLTSRSIGEWMGSENAINVSHTHSITDPGHTHVWNQTAGGAGAVSATVTAGAVSGSNDGGPTVSSTTGITLSSTGSSGTGANMQPSFFLKFHIKL